MPPALTILLITIATGSVDDTGSGDDPFTPAIARAAREALGPDVRVVSKRLETPPSDGDAVAFGAAIHADAVVEVTWSLPDHLRSTIRMERSSSGRWFDREVGFRTVDDPVERSRTVGFAIASMLPERAPRAAEVPPAANEVPRSSPPPPRPRERAAAAGEDASSVRGAASVRRTAPPSAEPLQHDNSISAVALAAFGIGDPGEGFGGGLDARRAFARTLSVRLGAGTRFGQSSSAEVAVRFFYGAAGLSWSAWASRNGRAAAGLRLDALLVFAQFGYRSAGSATVDKGKLMPGGDLLAEASYFFTRGVAVVAGGGGEALFGQTDVFIGKRRVTTLEPLHPVVELGVRVGF